MYNLYTKFVKILEICKQFSENLVNESVMFHVVVLFPSFRIWKWWRYPRRQRPRALIVRSGCSTINCKNTRTAFPISYQGRQFNDRRKKTAGLCEELRKRIAMEMDGGEEQFFVDSKPIEVCRVARGKRCKMGRTGNFCKLPTSASACRTLFILVISYTLSVG